MGVELGRRRLLLPPPPPPPPRRLGEKGGGRSERGGGWVLLCNFSPGRRARLRLQTGPPRRCGGGGPAGTRLPQGQEYVCADPLLCPPFHKPPQRACLAVPHRERPHAAAPFPCNPSSPALSDTLRTTRLRGGGADHPRGAAAGRAPAPPPPHPGQPAVTRRGADGGCRRGTGPAPEWVESRGAGRGREGGSEKTN